MTRWGSGPLFLLCSLFFGAAVLGIGSLNPQLYRIGFVPRGVLWATGAILIALGIPLWIAAVFTVMRAFSSGQLCTSGVFAICRHPVYASWAVLIVPGIALMLGSWLALTLPVFMCVLLRHLVRPEEEYLARTFGADYLAYRSRVPAMFPLGWLARRR
jgi:protein-S-isoprenylcysteine O-methyltransferase Ste14